MRIVKSVIEKQLDAYLKKTIKNTIINFAKAEMIRRKREVSIELLDNNNYDTSVPFLLDNNKLEELFEDEKLTNIIASLPEAKKNILQLSIIENYNSKEIAAIVGKSDSRIRHIINDTLNEIRNKYKE